jgi:NAD(P)H dehydrogenase (quinone)
MVLGLTGSTGQLGGLVARHLADAGVDQRLLVDRVSRAPRLPGATPVASGRYGDRESALAALRSVDVVFMVSAHESAERLEHHRAFVSAAADAGVSHIVYTSFLGAAPMATFTLARDHFATEQAIRGSGMQYTFLRNSLYLDVLPHFAGPDGVIRGPAGTGRLAPVARADVARAAAAVLRAPGEHAGATYQLTGSESMTLEDVAAILAEVTGRTISFHDETIDEAYASRAIYGAAPWQLDAWVSTYVAIRNGEMATVSDDVRTLTGREPMTLRQSLVQG